MSSQCNFNIVLETPPFPVVGCFSIGQSRLNHSFVFVLRTLVVSFTPIQSERKSFNQFSSSFIIAAMGGFDLFAEIL